MSTLLPFVLSIILPGTGQFVQKKYLLGISMIFIWLFLGLYIPYIPFSYFYYGTMIWSLIDIYIRMENISGRSKAIRYLIFSIIIAVIIIPSIFLLSTLTFIKGGRFMQSEFLGLDQTKDEMVEISDQLDSYFNYYKKYPSDYEQWIESKPIWEGWKRDSWGNNFRYTQSDSTNYTLTSSGKDGKFETEDDLIVRPPERK